VIGRSPKLPKLGRPKFKDVGQQRFADALIEWVESRDPAVGRGDRMEALLTRREAVEIGLIRTVANGNRMVPTAPDVSSVGLGPPVMTVPPAIEGMAADAAIQSIIISWPNQLGIYRNHSFTEIWRAETDDLGVAVLIGQSSGDLYGDAVGPGAGRYYWVRNISTTGIAGPFNGVSGTYAETGLDVPYLLSQIEGEIREDQLFASLATRISLIDAPASTTGSVNKRIADTASSLQSDIDTINATLEDIEAIPVFDSADNYAIDDLVKYDGSLYRCIQATTAPSELPTDTAYWELVGDYASLGEAVAAHAVLLDDHGTRITASEGDITTQAGQITTLQTGLSSAETDITANASAVTAIDTRVTSAEGSIVSQSSAIDALEASVNNATTGLSTKASSTDLTNAVAGVYGAEVASFTNINAEFDDVATALNLKAAVTYVDTAVATAEGDAIASATQQVWSALGEANAAGVETRATAWNGVSAQWEVKTQVGNLVAGVGLLNDGQKTRFYAQADSFAIYGTSVPSNRANAIPFTVVGGVTYIKNAAIQNASITSAKIQSLAADKIVANDLAAISADLGSITGGSLNINNRFIVTSGGVATIRSATTGARLEMSGDRINVYDSSNNLRVRIGRL